MALRHERSILQRITAAVTALDGHDVEWTGFDLRFSWKQLPSSLPATCCVTSHDQDVHWPSFSSSCPEVTQQTYLDQAILEQQLNDLLEERQKAGMVDADAPLQEGQGSCDLRQLAVIRPQAVHSRIEDSSHLLSKARHC